MELKDFIKESLTQISMAIEEANGILKDSSAVINPESVQVNSDSSQAYGRLTSDNNKKYYPAVHKVDFDVAVHVSNNQTAGAGAKISIASFQLGADGGVEYSNKSVSRLSFTIPIVYPEGKATSKLLKRDD